jgi:hypothetical protein
MKVVPWQHPVPREKSDTWIKGMLSIPRDSFSIYLRIDLTYLSHRRLFKAEMRLNHNMRLTEKAGLVIYLTLIKLSPNIVSPPPSDWLVLNINEIRTGVVHIASLLQSNDSLLQNLPSSSPPIMKSDTSIAKMLAWCEERVLAINEALVLDASKPAGIDDSKPLYARQTELASLISVREYILLSS